MEPSLEWSSRSKAIHEGIDDNSKHPSIMINPDYKMIPNQKFWPIITDFLLIISWSKFALRAIWVSVARLPYNLGVDTHRPPLTRTKYTHFLVKWLARAIFRESVRAFYRTTSLRQTSAICSATAMTVTTLWSCCMFKSYILVEYSPFQQAWKLHTNITYPCWNRSVCFSVRSLNCSKVWPLFYAGLSVVLMTWRTACAQITMWIHSCETYFHWLD